MKPHYITLGMKPRPCWGSRKDGQTDKDSGECLLTVDEQIRAAVADEPTAASVDLTNLTYIDNVGYSCFDLAAKLCELTAAPGLDRQQPNRRAYSSAPVHGPDAGLPPRAAHPRRCATGTPSWRPTRGRIPGSP